jgi:hypothetical protein
MRRIAVHIKANFIQILALTILVSAMFSASKKSVLPMLWGLGRFLLPVFIIWLIYRVVRARVSAAVKKFQEQMLQGMQQGAAAGHGPRGPSGGQVLDLCPKCGDLQNPGHRCRK